MDEGALRDDYSLPGPYRTSWYTPKRFGDTRIAAKRFCDGRKFPSGGWPDTVRVDGIASSAGSPIDWNADGAFGFGMDGSGSIQTSSQDVNFDGVIDDEPFHGYNDWAAVRLNQVGSGLGFWGFSADSSLSWNGAVVHPDGSVVHADGSVVHADGAVVYADGSVVHADGSVVHADGAVVYADGAVVYADGAVVYADGSVVHADGSVVHADGSVVHADGSVVHADGSVVHADGSVVHADGSVVHADGSVVHADGAALTSNLNELSDTVAAETGNVPGPRKLTACVIGMGARVHPDNPNPTPPAQQHRIRLDWEPPTVIVTPFSNYCAFRLVPGAPDKLVGATAGLSQLYLVDVEELPNQVEFTYYVVGCNVLPAPVTLTGQSNKKKITAVNDPPVAGTIAGLHLRNDNYTVYQQGVNTVAAAQGVLVNDAAGADSYPSALAAVAAVITTGRGATVTLRSDGSFDYLTLQKGPQFTDSFTYRATNGPWSGNPSVPLSASSTGAVTVNLTVRPGQPK